MYLNKTYLVYFIVLIVFASSSCRKTEPGTLQKNSFVKSFGGSFADEAVDIITDNNNLFILGTVRDQFDSTLIFLTKTDEFGNTLWSSPKKYTINNKNTRASQIIKLQQDNRFLILGSIETDTDSLYFDTYVALINSDGDIIKDSAYAAIDTNHLQRAEYGICMIELSNEDICISSNIYNPSNNSFIVSLTMIIDTSLVIKRRSPIAIEINSICKKKSNNDGFLISATSNGYTGIANFDRNGNYGTFAKLDQINGEIKSIAQNSLGETFICGVLNKSGSGTNGFIAKLTDPEQSTQTDWFTQYSISDLEFGNDGYTHMEITPNDEILLTGITEHADDIYNIWVVKTDEIGNKLYENSFGGSDSEQGVKIIGMKENSFIVLSTNGYSKNSFISVLKSGFE